MSFIPLALASPRKDQVFTPGEWIASEKIDGHRLLVAVGGPGSTLFDSVGVRAWSRDGLSRVLPPHLREALARLPVGLYDGELLVPGQRSYGVTVLDNQHLLVYIVFDVLSLLGRDLTASGLAATYDERRAAIEEILTMDGPVRLGWSIVIQNDSQIDELAREVWNADGEGLVLKKRSSLYYPGKRMKEWIKIKQLLSAVLTVVGFQAGKMGLHSIIILQDDEGIATSVKWKNLEVLRAIEANPKKFIGRKLTIQYQERTFPDNGYRHPRFDHWTEEEI